MDNLSIYIHWPYCLSKCPYCDFNSHVAESIDHYMWLDAYRRELGFYAEKTGDRNITSIFFGGGTPSLMKPHVIEGVLEFISEKWQVNNDCEITLEANPTSVEADKFEGFKQAGINRVSVGVQSLNKKDLKFLGREHSPNEALKAVETASKIFDRFSFDMIYARPKQTIEEWQKELTFTLNHMGNHASLYQLTIEPNTPFFTRYKRGDFQIPNEELGADLYLATEDIMNSVGFTSYEVSNYGREGDMSIHNLAYWRYQDYLGIGPGAHGRVTLDGQKHATRMHRAPQIWMEKVFANGNGLQDNFPLTIEEQSHEKVLMGLRLKEGVSAELLPASRIAVLVQNGDLIKTENGNISATTTGRLRLNAVLDYLINSTDQIAFQ